MNNNCECPNETCCADTTADFRTKLTGSGTGRIISKSDIEEVNGSKVITVVVGFARRRQSAGGLITEEDVVPIKFWASGAEIMADLARVDQYIYVETEIRARNRIEIKAQHFELL